MRTPGGRDAAITGASAFTPLGHGLQATWDALAAGRGVTGPVARVEPPHLRSAIPEALESQAKFLNGGGRLAAEAVALAIADARLAAAGHEPTAKALYLAAIDLTPADFVEYHASFREATEGFSRPAGGEGLNVATQRKMNPFYLLETLNNNAFSFVSVWHALHGANTCISGWASPGLVAASLAARAVARGDASAAVACGVGRGTGVVVGLEFERLKLLGAGVVPSEGAGALVLEPLSDATARGASVIAVVLGSCATNGSGGRRASALRAAAEIACEEAGLSPAKAGAILGPAEACETLDGVPKPFDTRRKTGDMGPGSEATDLALAARALAKGSYPDGRAAGESALVLATGPEGQAAAVVLGRAG